MQKAGGLRSLCMHRRSGVGRRGPVSGRPVPGVPARRTWNQGTRQREWQGHSQGCSTPACMTNPEHSRGAVAVYRNEVSSMSLCPPAHHADIMDEPRMDGASI